MLRPTPMVTSARAGDAMRTSASVARPVRRSGSDLIVFIRAIYAARGPPPTSAESPFGLPSGGAPAHIDGQCGAVDEPRLGGGEEQGRPGDVDRVEHARVGRVIGAE